MVVLFGRTICLLFAGGWLGPHTYRAIAVCKQMRAAIVVAVVTKVADHLPRVVAHRPNALFRVDGPYDARHPPAATAADGRPAVRSGEAQ